MAFLPRLLRQGLPLLLCLGLQAETRPLRDLYQGVLIGTTATYGGSTTTEGIFNSPNKDIFLEIFNREFSLGQTTCYPAWDTWTGPKTYDFSKVNASVNYIRGQGMQVAMHLLSGPNGYYPAWFKTGNYTAAELDEMLEHYIRSVMQTNDNASKVRFWNVVNECIASNNHYYAELNGDSGSLFQKMGYEPDKSGLTGAAKVHTEHPIWIRKAFEYAAKYATPDCRLELRDYNIEFWQVYKSAAFYQLVRHLLNSGAPLHAVGLQAHFSLTDTFSWSLLTRTVQEYKKLGLEVYLTELDIGDKDKSWTEAKAEKQRDMYQKAIQAAVEGGVDWICLWGLHDNANQYWRYDENPLLYDKVFAAKPAYTGFASGLAPVLAKAPAILSGPRAATVAPGLQASLSCEVRGQAPLTYQWYKDGQPLAGANTATLLLPKAQASQSGSYSVTVSNAGGSTTSEAARLTIATPVPGRITNLSVRAQAGLNGQALIVGFSPEGAKAKQLLVRGGGPALLDFNVSTALTDPFMKVYEGQTLLTENDDWSTNGAEAGLRGLFDKVGAFSYKSGSKDAALALSITGPRSVHINGKAGASGVVLVEAYDTDTTTDTRLVNVSARNYCGTGNDVLIAGFVIDGNVPKRLLIRGVGPGLEKFQVPGCLQDPRLELHTTIDNQDVTLATNDNWSERPEALTLRTLSGPFALDPGSKDAAMIVTLPPGAYSAMVIGNNGGTGEALVEVYELP